MRWPPNWASGRFVCPADLRDAAEPDALVAAAEQAAGPLAILVNNAGMTRDMLALRMRDEDWQAVLDVDLSAPFRLIRAALRGMLRRRAGRIINISSIVGATGNAGQANYAAAKAGLVGMTKALAQEVASRGITVNVVAPGFIATPMTDKLAGTATHEADRGDPLATTRPARRCSSGGRLSGLGRGGLGHRRNTARQWWHGDALRARVGWRARGNHAKRPKASSGTDTAAPIGSCPAARHIPRIRSGAGSGQSPERDPSGGVAQPMSEIADKVKKIVVEHLGVEEAKVTPEASFIDDLGADSLDTVELVMAFEEAFSVEIPEDAAEKISTVKDAIDYIEKQKAA